MRKTLALDFDGVLHGYSKGWQNGVIYDDPVPGAIEATQSLAQEYSLVVFTARQDLDAVRHWLQDRGFPAIEVTNQKPPAWAYIDDRGIMFRDWPSCLAELAVFGKEGP